MTSIFAPSGTSTSTEVDGIYGVGPLGLREEGVGLLISSFAPECKFGDPSGETSANLESEQFWTCASVHKVRGVRGVREVHIS